MSPAENLRQTLQSDDPRCVGSCAHSRDHKCAERRADEGAHTDWMRSLSAGPADPGLDWTGLARD